jgi:hypothetical protein
MKEITPKTGSAKTLAPVIVGTTIFPACGKSFMLTFNVQPAEVKKGRLGISLLPEDDERTGCELQIALDDQRAQLAPASLDHFAAYEKSLREGGAPQQVGNYAIENLIGVDGLFTVRVIVKGDDKLGGSLIDVEIAGQRTMISYRPDLTVKKLLFRTDGLEFKKVQIYSLLTM